MSNPYPQINANQRPVPPGKGCSHGKLWAEYCRQCEIIDTTRMRDEAVRRAAMLNERLARLEAEK